MSKSFHSSKFLRITFGDRLARIIFLLLVGVAGSVTARAQYPDYPQTEGQAQKFVTNEQKIWKVDVEVRGRTENQTSLNFISGNNELYELTRIRGGIAVSPTSWVAGYLQFHDDHALSLPLAQTASNMRDSFDLRQGFVDLHGRKVRFVAGRQELKLGDERVLGVSDWANNGRSWDGFDLKVGGKNRLEVFSTSVVVVHPTSRDKHGAGLTFHGATAQITTWVPKTTIAPFVFLRRLPTVVSQQKISGAENEVTTGAYVTTQLPLGFEISATGTLQRGSYSNDSIHAGSGIVKAAYIAKNIPWKPRVMGEYDYATGNPHTNALRIGSNDQLYPSNHNAFGLVDLFGFSNIKQLRGEFEVKPTSTFAFLFQAGSLHVVTVRDGVYASSGSTLIKAPTLGFSGDGLGTEFDASAKYIYRKVLVNKIGVGHLFPGEVLTHNAHGAPLTLVYFQMKYRFTLQ